MEDIENIQFRSRSAEQIAEMNRPKPWRHPDSGTMFFVPISNKLKLLAVGIALIIFFAMRNKDKKGVKQKGFYVVGGLLTLLLLDQTKYTETGWKIRKSIGLPVNEIDRTLKIKGPIYTTTNS